MLRCPHCHQSITTERCGIRLPLLKAGIFDVIKQAGDFGITTEELAHEIYRDRRRRPSKYTVKAHIWQINERLEETPWIIRSEGDYGTAERRWYLRRRHVRRVA